MEPKILVVDDEEDIIDLVQSWLESEGYSVITAYNGKDALKAVASERPNLILLDAIMPRMSGMEVCQTLKRDSNTRSIPVVMFTVLSRSVDVKMFKDAGADDHLAKPFTGEDLIAVVETQLEGNRT